MAAGTVISGGFPGRVAQEVQPNPKCNGCLHFDGQGGRTGVCTIGLRPWLCGEGDASDIGYAPISRGAGTYLPGMSSRSVQAPHAGDQDASDLYGAGSTRGVQFQQVSLGEEHVHFVKSIVENHNAVQRSMCRLCKSTGSTLGTTHSNIGPQVCTCEPIAARDIAKALMPRLSNRERSVVTFEDATGFVYEVAKAGFDARAMSKGTFYHQHGKYEVSPSGSGQHHVDFHPRGGGKPTRVATVDSHKEGRRAADTHALRFASGTGADNAGHKPKSTHTPAGLPSMKDAVSVAKKALSWSDHPTGQKQATTEHGAYRHSDSDVHYMPWASPGRLGNATKLGEGSSKRKLRKLAEEHHAKKSDTEKGLDGGDVEKAIDNAKHSHIVTGRLAPEGRGYSNVNQARNAVDKLDSKYGASAHSYKPNPNFKPAAAPSPSVEKGSRDYAGDHREMVTRHGTYKIHQVGETNLGMNHKVTYHPKDGGPVEHVPVGGDHASRSRAKMAIMTHGAKVLLREDSATKKSVDDVADAITKAVAEIEKAGKTSEEQTGRPLPKAPPGSIEMLRPPHGSKPMPQGRHAALREQRKQRLAKLKPSHRPSGPGGETNPSFSKSLDDLLWELHEDEDVEKSLRWSHKIQGNAKTSHGSYQVAAHPSGGHTVTYTHKKTGRTEVGHYKSHREALGALTEHHLKNRPPPKKRKPKAAKAPEQKQLTARAGAAPHCPPCP